MNAATQQEVDRARDFRRHGQMKLSISILSLLVLLGTACPQQPFPNPAPIPNPLDVKLASPTPLDVNVTSLVPPVNPVNPVSPAITSIAQGTAEAIASPGQVVILRYAEAKAAVERSYVAVSLIDGVLHTWFIESGKKVTLVKPALPATP